MMLLALRIAQRLLPVFELDLLNCSVPAVSMISRTTCLPCCAYLLALAYQTGSGSYQRRRRCVSGMNPLSLGHSALQTLLGRIALYTSASIASLYPEKGIAYSSNNSCPPRQSPEPQCDTREYQRETSSHNACDIPT